MLPVLTASKILGGEAARGRPGWAWAPGAVCALPVSWGAGLCSQAWMDVPTTLGTVLGRLLEGPWPPNSWMYVGYLVIL